jgi:hypothetical protein
MNKSGASSHDWRGGLLCVGVVFAAMALTFPVAESGVNDDWSYNKVALDLAQTGHLHYNWPTGPMLGTQAWWGALFIKLFGFSFLTVRLSTMPLAGGCAILLYSLHRRTGLPRGLAVLGTLTIALSPAFILNAVTFMTDVPALFFFLASTYGFVRVGVILDGLDKHIAENGTSSKSFWGWLIFATVSGILGGSIRQTVWIMPCVAPLALLIRQQTFFRTPSVRLPLMLGSVITVAAAIFLVDWFHHQSNALATNVNEGFQKIFRPGVVMFLCRYVLRILLTAIFLIFPLFVVLPALYRSWKSELSLTWLHLRGVLLMTVLWGIIFWEILDYRWLFPWLDTIYIFPFLLGTYPIPHSAVSPLLPMHCREAISLFFIAILSGFFAVALPALCSRRFRSVRKDIDCSFHLPLVLLSCFSIVYLPLLLLKVALPDGFGIFDRYLLPVLPIGTIGLLLLFHRWTGRISVPRLAWIFLAAFASFGVVQTHDYFAQLRARVIIIGYLENMAFSPRTFWADSNTMVGRTSRLLASIAISPSHRTLLSSKRGISHGSAHQLLPIISLRWLRIPICWTPMFRRLAIFVGCRQFIVNFRCRRPIRHSYPSKRCRRVKNPAASSSRDENLIHESATRKFAERTSPGLPSYKPPGR